MPWEYFTVDNINSAKRGLPHVTGLRPLQNASHLFDLSRSKFDLSRRRRRNAEAFVREAPASGTSQREAEVRRLLRLFGGGSRRQVRQSFHPGTLNFPPERCRTDAKPPAAAGTLLF